MTIAEMRALLGLGEEYSDAEVAERYALFMAGGGTPSGLMADTEPVSLEMAKIQLRIDDDSAEDGLIARQISTAREIVEKRSGHILVPRPVTQAFDRFDRLRLRAWPVAEGGVVNVRYIDPTGAAQEYVGARLAASARPVIVLPAVGLPWPATYAERGAVTITVNAGYVEPGLIPSPLVSAILGAVTDLYENRSEALSEAAMRTVAAICDPYRHRIL